MAEELFIPQLGQTVETVVLINWLVEEGAKVEIGTPVLDVETDKAIFTVEANAKGYLHKGPQKAGETVPVLTVVGTIGKQNETFLNSPSIVTNESHSINKGNATNSVINSSQIPPEKINVNEGERLFVSPRARKLADSKKVAVANILPTGNRGTRVIENDVVNYLNQIPKVTPVAAAIAEAGGVDLVGMVGTGASGVITKSDVENVLNQRSSSPAPTRHEKTLEVEVTESIPLIGVRGIIFDRMGKSVHTSARVTLTTEVDATDFVATRERLKESVSESWGFSPGYNDMLAIIVAKSLRELPYMNARISADNKSIEFLGHVNLGMAVDTERGLTVPVIPNADRLGMRQFGIYFRTLVDRARVGRSTPEDLSSGTFTITNLGMYDVDFFTPVINLPESSILAVGRIQGKVVPYNNEIRIRQMMALSLVFDHRIIDGAPAARFLQKIKQYIENPLLLLS